MLIRLIIRLFWGYVRIEVEGYYVERFINICTNRKILIWNLKREKGVKLYLNIGINDFKKISEIARKTSCKVRILKKKGIPFLLNKYKKRKLFVLLLALVICIVFISSRYVWNIEVNVEDNLELENIAEDLENAGLTKGVLKTKIDTDRIINEIRLKRSDIAWVGLDIKGTNIIVSIVKADKSPEIIDNLDYCNIVASKAGTITKITAQNGTAIVNVGDEVSQGDVLIAGYMDGKYTDRRYVHSLGEVEAKVLYSETKAVELKKEIYKETGNMENKYEINFNKLKLKLYKNPSKYETYQSEKNVKNIKLFGDFYLPISITKITNKEEIKEEQNYTAEEATKATVEDLTKILDEKIQNKDLIVDKNVETEEGENSVIVTLCYEVLEKIGENKKIE